MAKALPHFVPPMLAVSGRPFDSEEHFFEFKWDGFRAAAMIEHGTLRLMSRSGLDLAERFPGLSGLSLLPSGLVLDGELVAFRDGRPSFDRMLQREPGAGAQTVRYIAFDLLYERFDARLQLPFSERRRILKRVVEEANCPELLLSEGVRTSGRALFSTACEQGLEGVMSKRLSSPYAPGKRNKAWIKIKRRLKIQVAIIGYLEKPGNDFQSLLVAGTGLPGEEPGRLRYLGRVGGGFTVASRAQVNALLRKQPRKTPLVSCPERGRWVEPGLYCEISYAELTEAGLLRAPVFEGVIDE